MNRIKEILKPLGFMIFGVVMAFVGFLGAAYLILGIEMNDRLKYEAAYAKGYFKVLNAIDEGDVDKARRMLNFYIDAHFITLSEYRFLENSLQKTDIDNYLCDVAKYKTSSIEISHQKSRDKIEAFAKKILNENCESYN